MDEELAKLFLLVGAVALAYGKAVGSTQAQVSQWVIDAWQVKSRYRGLINLAVGMVLAGAFGLLAAWQGGDWSVLAVIVLAGIVASVEAAKAHDEAVTKTAQAHQAGQEGEPMPKVTT